MFGSIYKVRQKVRLKYVWCKNAIRLANAAEMLKIHKLHDLTMRSAQEFEMNANSLCRIRLDLSVVLSTHR